MVEGQLVHLEVTGHQNFAGGSAHEHCERIRNGVRHRNKFQAERADLGSVMFIYDVQGWVLQAVLAQLGLNERQCQVRPIDRDVRAQFEQVGDGADVIFVAVGQYHRLHIVEALLNPREVRQNQVNTWLTFFGEENAAVDDEQLSVIFEDGHVAADLTEATEGHDPHGALG